MKKVVFLVWFAPVLIETLRTKHAKMIVFVLMLVGMSCIHCIKKNEANNKNMPTQIEIAAAKATVEKLLPNFEYEKIKFTEAKAYDHKNNKDYFVETNNTLFNNPVFSAVAIQARIYNSILLFSSQFLSNNRLFHYKVLVNIDEKIMTVFGDYVNYHGDQLEYLLTDKNDILYFIAVNPDKEVKVRLKGYRDQHFDFTLDKAQHEAICQTVELYGALMILKRADIDPQTGEKVKPDDFFPDHSP